MTVPVRSSMRSARGASVSTPKPLFAGSCAEDVSTGRNVSASAARSALEHDAEKLHDFLDNILRENVLLERVVDTGSTYFARIIGLGDGIICAALEKMEKL
ncbi:hypothetical protein [Fulvimarina sp. MAC3]|uniref:hypothetical protein n=1 Tax=Fulvimarina sp. MAC3 TaxID=3148887 RepID=UPI0031FD9499